jgi:hydroxymethylglutaryl-CoA reductase (NADPH)
MPNRIPRDKSNDYSEHLAQQRRTFATEQTGASLAHVGKYSIDPA